LTELVVGLDFGTSNTSLAVSDAAGAARLLPIDPLADPPTVLPTQVYFGRTPQGPFTSVGAQAWKDLLVQGVRGEARFLFELKAVMGLPLKATLIDGRNRTMGELVAEVLRPIKARADAAVGQTVTRVVCGRPVQFSEDPDVDRRALETLDDALEKVGFTERVFGLEPVAADFAPREGDEAEKGPAEGVTLTVDIGGGTLDVSLVRRAGSKPPEVLAVVGKPEAGRNVDRRIVFERLLQPFGRGTSLAGDKKVPEWVLNKVGAWSELHLLAEDPHLVQTLTRLETQTKSKLVASLKRYFRERQGYGFLKEVEARKIELSSLEKVAVRFVGGGLVVMEPLTRKDLGPALLPLVTAVDVCVDAALKSAGLRDADVAAVERIGGSSRIPAVGDRLAARFGREKVRGQGSLTAVALGLAELGRRHYLLRDASTPVVA